MYVIFIYFIPSVSKPTYPPWIAKMTPTTIDNIFWNILDSAIFNKIGILYTDISDHLAVFKY